MEPSVSSKRNTSDIREITLSDLMHRVGVALRQEFTQGYWFSCDIDSINRHASGNVYLTLSHKNEGGQRSSAKAMIWKNNAGLIQKFESQTGIRFSQHISVMLLGQVTFNSEYGLSIKIIDINPTFSVGQHELKLRQIREQLQAKGFAHLNLSLPRPLEFTRVAVIAPNNAAGLHDFKTKADSLQLHGLCQFDYYHALFQGDRRVDTITAAFTELVQNDIDYDAVCLIRGGGDAASLSELAEWKIALCVCRCPYPVFSGIGHESDEILIDEYANIGFPTPSMVVSHIFDTIVSNAKHARSSFEYMTRTARLMVDSQRQECELYNESVFTRMWVATNSWRMHINQQRDIIFNTSKQAISNSQFSVTNDFNRVLSSSRSGVNEQKRITVSSYELIRMGAFKAAQQAKTDVKNLKVEVDRQSRFTIDMAKQAVVRNFNNLQLSSTRVVSEQRSILNQVWLELNTQAKAQLNIAKQGLSHELITTISNTKRHVSASRMEAGAYWSDTIQLAANSLDRAKDKVVSEYKVIDAYDPQKTLERGYSIVYSSDGEVIKESVATSSGQEIQIRMKDGTFDAKVDK